jgi:hypothetical protein
MICFGSSSVEFGNECGQHPKIHASTEDCASEDDPFVCVDGNNEIFAFDTVLKDVTTECLSMSGTCASEAAFSTVVANQFSLEECRQLCIDTVSPDVCVFFEHVNDDCTIYTRSSINVLFVGIPCGTGVLGFICRLSGSDDVISSRLVLDDADPAFYTEIHQGLNILTTIVHGELHASTMKMDRSGEETAFVLDFESSYNVTGGQVTYVCGHDQNDLDNTVLFTHPASEDDHFVNTSIQECYISNKSLAFHEKQLSNSADPTMKSCIDKRASGIFFAQGSNEDGPFKFYNIKPGSSTSKSSGPTGSSTVGAFVSDEQWTVNENAFVTFSVPPGKSLKSVVAYSAPQKPTVYVWR